MAGMEYCGLSGSGAHAARTVVAADEWKYPGVLTRHRHAVAAYRETLFEAGVNPAAHGPARIVAGWLTALSDRWSPRRFIDLPGKRQKMQALPV